MSITTNKFLTFVCQPLIKLTWYISKHNPELVIKARYFTRFHKRINLNNPRDLNEKILNLSLRTDTSMWTTLADKYAVRKYVEECGLADTLVKLYGHWDKAEDIDFTKLPNSFILKSVQGSGDPVIVKDKSQFDQNKTVAYMSKVYSKLYGGLEAGCHYMRIKPGIIAEEFLNNDEESKKVSNTLIDYKIWCVNGRAEFIWTCCNRTPPHGVEVMTYDREWNVHPEYSVFDSIYRKGTPMPAPKNLNGMLEVAEKLAKPFPIVRVDLYNLNGKIYFGEMTFTSLGGLMNFYTPEFLLKVGNMIDLNYKG
ncbi:hypothetical protein IX307_000592 [Bacteroides pyogenes]|uniref:ATP-grasp fold amidoligase family protein n=1 Tax=Bacteroides pyogenes TaxID=310300 RepID=UPI001BA524C8|nr:ATP-grasp fold amidoligase family protein [Bacteroides pyogenes]MBR8719426.1 hypothetical protein [Bacteroides pyogenes]MBR8786289.1 hypothetical protein [Bacteroides pyogenes]MBR8791772.1 hypothetical protein [Bacteroides pyogenes]MCF2708810.1 hypothetical protein [Bacteroides pyogenes]